MQRPSRIDQIWLTEQEINGVPCSQSYFCWRELSRNSGHLWGPGETLGCTEITLELTQTRGYVFLPHLCWCSSLLLMCQLDEWGTQWQWLILFTLRAPRLVCWCVWGLGRGYHWLKGLSPGPRKGLGESSREQPDLRRVRCMSLKIHKPRFLGKLSQPSPI